MLLIAATVLPVEGTMNNENIIRVPDVGYGEFLDQTRGGSWIEGNKLLE